MFFECLVSAVSICCQCFSMFFRASVILSKCCLNYSGMLCQCFWNAFGMLFQRFVAFWLIVKYFLNAYGVLCECFFNVFECFWNAVAMLVERLLYVIWMCLNASSKRSQLCCMFCGCCLTVSSMICRRFLKVFECLLNAFSMFLNDFVNDHWIRFQRFCIGLWMFFKVFFNASQSLLNAFQMVLEWF